MKKKTLPEATAYQRYEFEEMTGQAMDVLAASRTALGYQTPVVEGQPLWGQWQDNRNELTEILAGHRPAPDTAFLLDAMRLLLEKTEALFDLRVAEIQFRMSEQVESLREEIRLLRQPGAPEAP